MVHQVTKRGSYALHIHACVTIAHASLPYDLGHSRFTTSLTKQLHEKSEKLGFSVNVRDRTCHISDAQTLFRSNVGGSREAQRSGGTEPRTVFFPDSNTFAIAI